MHVLAINIFLIAQVWAGPMLEAGKTAPATQPAGAATQPAAVATTQPATGERINIVEILRGNQRLRFEDLKDFPGLIDAAYDLVKEVLGWIPKIFVAFLFLVVFWIIYRGIRKLVVGSMGKANVDSSIRDMLASLLKWSIMGFGLVIAFNQIGVQITALLTGVSIIGLAIGFAAQETLANFIAGVVIFWDRPFRVGDWVMVEGVFGQVQRITFRSTRILDLDGQVNIFPNTFMLAHKVANHSTNLVSRLSIPIGIAYKESIDAARSALLALIGDDPRICKNPIPRVVVAECAASSVNLELQFWLADESIEEMIRYEYNEKAKKAMDAAKIEIPFPHMQLFLEKSDALTGLLGRLGERKAG